MVGEFAGGIADDKLFRFELQADIRSVGTDSEKSQMTAARHSTCYRDIAGQTE